MIVYMSDFAHSEEQRRLRAMRPRNLILHRFLIGAFLLALPLQGQNAPEEWQAQVRRYSELKDWVSAMRIVDQEIARAPRDMDVRAWRARVLAWSGNSGEAEREYLQILQVSKSDPDNWLGLANVYVAEGKIEEALRALDAAVALDPGRADVHTAPGHTLALAGDRKNARLEFQQALRLDPANGEALAAQKSVLGEPKNELRVSQEDNAFNFTNPNYSQWISVRTQWNRNWSTTFVGNFFQWNPTEAAKVLASVTGQLPKWGALTMGAAAGHDNGVLPKSEAFFELAHGWKTSEA